MRFDWQQLSPKEREVLLRHFLLQRKDAPVSAQRVCGVMQKTHHLVCDADAAGKAVIRFETTRKGNRSGSSVSDDLAEGIYKAALRARGVDLEDGAAAPFLRRTAREIRAGR